MAHALFLFAWRSATADLSYDRLAAALLAAHSYIASGAVHLTLFVRLPFNAATRLFCIFANARRNHAFCRAGLTADASLRHCMLPCSATRARWGRMDGTPLLAAWDDRPEHNTSGAA